MRGEKLEVGMEESHQRRHLSILRQLAKALRNLRLGDLLSEASRFTDVAAAIKSLVPQLEANSIRSMAVAPGASS